MSILALPENKLSDIPVLAPMLTPDDLPFDHFLSYEKGGIDLKDPTQGLQVRDWLCYYSESTGKFILRSEPDKEYTILEDLYDVQSMDFTFDQNMNFILTYELPNLVCKLHWFDAETQDYVISTFTGCRSPRLTLDDKRQQTLLFSDILFLYIKENGDLMFRQQRDRYMTERILRGGFPADQHLLRIGMTKNFRVQFNSTKKLLLPACGMGVSVS